LSGRTLGLTAFLALALAGCGGPGGPSIVLYNGQHPQLTDELVAAFERQTGIAVELRTNDGVILADQILQEGSSSPADVYISENTPELMSLQEHGKLARLGPAVLGQVPAADVSPAGEWIGMALRVSSLVYNPALLPASGLPRSVLDLARPGWKGKIAVAPTDSDFPPVVGAVASTFGTTATAAWLSGLKRNAQTYQDEEAVVAAVNRGDVAAGIVNQYYWYRLQLELGTGAMHSRLYYFPRHDPGSITNISGAAVLASSRKRADAQRFVAFLVSKAGQQIIARSDDFEYPARPGVKARIALPPLETLAHDTLSAVALGDDQQAARLITQAGLI
jgi:iron(III) transport system substrate-binding protein